MIYRLPLLFPKAESKNIVICTTAAGNRDSFSVLISDTLPDVHMSDKSGASQCFPLYLYEPADAAGELDYGEGEIIDGYRRRDAITDSILKTFRAAYGAKASKEEIFYYVYGILHSPEYRARFAADLKKMLPRIPLTKEVADFKAFSKAGRDLAEWHLNYETIGPYPVTETDDGTLLPETEKYIVQKMTFARPTAEQKKAGLKWDKTKIHYNSHITLSGIPLEAYEYVVNGKPAIEWILERYQVTRDKDSGIVNDPNDWAKEHKQPRYILDLLKRVVRVSVETMKIVSGLPALNEQVLPTVPMLQAVELLVAILDELKPARVQMVAAERIFILAVNRQARELFERGALRKTTVLSEPGDPFRILWQTATAMGVANITADRFVERTDEKVAMTDSSHRTMAKEAVAVFKKCEAMDREWPVEVNDLEFVVS